VNTCVLHISLLQIQHQNFVEILCTIENGKIKECGH